MEAVAGVARREVKVVGLLSFAHFFSHFYMIALAPLYPLIQPELGASWTEIGFAIAAFALFTGILQTPMGFLVERIGGRAVLIFGLFVIASAMSLIGFVTSLWQLMVLMSIAGIGNSVFHPADYSIISSTVAEKRLGKAFSYHTFGGSIGMVVSPIIMVALSALFGWRMAISTVGIVGLGLAVIIVLASGVIGDGGKSIKKVGAGPAWRALVTSRPIRLFFVFGVFAAAANSGIVNFSVKAFQDIYGIELAAAAVALTVYQACSMACVLPGGLAADRSRYQDVILIVGFGLTGVFVVLAGIGILPFWLAVIMLGMAGGMRGFINASRDVSVRHAAGDLPVGTVFAWVTTGFLIGQSIGPAIYGVLLDLGEPTIVFWASGVFSLLAVSTVFFNESARAKRR